MENNFAEGYAVGRDASNNSNNGAWGADGGFFWWIIVFALIFGWGGNGFGGFGGNGGSMLSGALTRGDLCQDMNFNDLQNGVRNVSDAVNVGFANLNSTICHQQYDTAMLLNNMNVSNLQGFNAMNVSNLQSFNALQSQLADCCCTTQRAIDGVNYNMATNTCAITNAINNSTRDIIASQQAGFQGIRDYLCNEKISALENENFALRLSASQEKQNNYLVSQLRPFPTASYVVPNPFTGYYGFNNGCGCGNGCANF